MFHSELFIKIRAYIVLFFLLIIAPIPITISWIYTLLALFVRLRKFKNIQGEVAVITGAGHGLGRCIALQLAKRGCHIAIVDINLEGAEETAKIIKSKYNVESKAYKVDVTSFEQIEDLNNKITKDIGLATILINNAGILTLSNFAKPDPEEIQRMINVNLVSHFWTNRIFLENMKKKRRGHIVAICSIAGVFPLPYSAAYVVSKFGVRGMMRTMRLELRMQGLNDIHTTTICPTFLQTNAQVVEYSNEANVGVLYPLVKGEDAAKKVVHAMLRNEKEVFISRGFAILCRLFDAFPSAIQDTLFMLVTKSFMSKFQKIYDQHAEAINARER